MIRPVLITLSSIILAGAPTASFQPRPQADAPPQRNARLPLEFEQNLGQTDRAVSFLARAPQGALYLTGSGAIVQTHGVNFDLTFAGSNTKSTIRGESRLPGLSNYLLGNDSRKWIRGIPHFAQVRYSQVYPGIDLLYHGGQQSLEYDFVVAPGADPSAIGFRFGDAHPTLEANGDLSIPSGSQVLRQSRPVVYQEVRGKRIPIAGAYRLRGTEVRFEIGAYDPKLPLIIDPVITFGGTLTGTGSITTWGMSADSAGSAYITGQINSLDFPTVNPLRKPSGTTGLFTSRDAAATWTNTSTGLTGAIEALAIDLKNPSTVYAGTAVGAFKTVNGGQTWALIPGVPKGAYGAAAVDPTNSSIVYMGTAGGIYKTKDGGATWAILPQVTAQITSITLDPRNPQTIYATAGFGFVYRSTDGGTNWLGYSVQGQLFTALVDPTNSSIIYAGYLGVGLFVSTDAGLSFNQKVVVPGTAGAADVHAIAIDPRNPSNVLVGTGTGVYRSVDGANTFSAGSGPGAGLKILQLAFDPQNPTNVFAGTEGGGVLKSTDSGSSWTSAGPSNLDAPALAVNAGIAFTGLSANTDGYISKIDPTGKNLVYSTYFGGSGSDRSLAILADTTGSAYVCGLTDSGDFPTRNPLQAHLGGSTNMFLARLNPAGSDLAFSTYFGGSGQDNCSGIALDAAANIYLSGYTFAQSNNNFPSTPGAFKSPKGIGQDCAVVKLSPNAATLIYSLRLGGSGLEICNGIAVDSNGSAYVVGQTQSVDFPATQVRLSPTISLTGSQTVGFVTKVSPDGSQLMYSALLGGRLGDSQAESIAVNAAGRATVAGLTRQSDFPLTPGVINTNNIGTKGFVLQVETDGSSLVFSTLLPGLDFDVLEGVALDAKGTAWVSGIAVPNGSNTLPLTPDALDTRPRPVQGAFLQAIDSTGSKLLYSSFVGGTGYSVGTGIALGPAGSVFVYGSSANGDLNPPAGPLGAASASPDYTMYVQRIDFPAAGAPLISVVEDGATFTVAPVSDGALVVIGGSNLSAGPVTAGATLTTLLGGTSVKINNSVFAPLYYVSANQIDFQMPAGIAAGNATVTVTSGGVTSPPASIQVAQSAPHIFIFGNNRAAVRNLDQSINTADNPAAGGSVISAYFTGIGPLDHAVADGQPAPSDPLSRATLTCTATIGGTTVTPSYCGLTPQSVGLAQANIAVPQLPPGDYLLSLTIGAATSNAAFITIR